MLNFIFRWESVLQIYCIQVQSEVPLPKFFARDGSEDQRVALQTAQRLPDNRKLIAICRRGQLTRFPAVGPTCFETNNWCSVTRPTIGIPRRIHPEPQWLGQLNVCWGVFGRTRGLK